MPKINREEYEVLKEAQEEGYKWIARNYNGALIIYTSKPMKNPNLYWDGFGKRMDDRLFKFIQWEDEGPYEISELIEEYEDYAYTAELFSNEMRKLAKALGESWKESEETEVKTLESIREEIWEEMLRLEDKRKDQWADIKYQTLREVLQKLGHLDEPEVLSQEFINEKVVDVYADTADAEVHAVFRMRDLQNLLVPKHELPVIPKFVAEAIEEDKECGYDVYESIDLILGTNGGGLPSISDWVARNIDKYASAWLNGFTVEEEPLYRARLKVITDEFIASYLRTQSSDAEDRLKALEIGSKYIHEDYRHLSEFTEDELKRLNIWDSEQWEVEGGGE